MKSTTIQEAAATTEGDPLAAREVATADPGLLPVQPPDQCRRGHAFHRAVERPADQRRTAGEEAGGRRDADFDGVVEQAGSLDVSAALQQPLPFIHRATSRRAAEHPSPGPDA